MSEAFTKKHLFKKTFIPESMKGICLYFEVHQPVRLKRYRFFNMGNDHYYYDDFTNETILRRVADQCYLPANRILLEMIKKHKGDFKVSFSITGVLLDQLATYMPEVIDSFRSLAETGKVEFLAETYSHSLASMIDREEFEIQVRKHSEKIFSLFNIKPTSFRNTELIYSDTIGSWVADMGFSTMLTEGAKHILGWRSPDFLYCNSINPKLKVMLRNFQMSDDIAFRFGNQGWSEWPLTTDKFAGWIKNKGDDAELINLFIDYETFGEHQKSSSGILDFLRTLPGAVLSQTDYKFMTPSDVEHTMQPVSAIHVPDTISWADEERDLTAWLGNDLQKSAFEKLYSLAQRVRACGDEALNKDWEYLQVSDHFYYMCTKFFSDGAVHAYFNPYESPYEAFMNYMNVLSDFEIRLNNLCPTDDINREIVKLKDKNELQIDKITKQEMELRKLRTRVKDLTAAKSELKKSKDPGINTEGKASAKKKPVK